MSRPVFLGAVGMFMLAGLITFFWPADGIWFASGSREILDDARAAIQATLRDPSSALFYDELVFGKGKSRTVCGNVNARNGFGGYTGKSAFIYRERLRAFKIASNSGEADSIVEACKFAELDALCDRERPNDPTCKR